MLQFIKFPVLALVILQSFTSVAQAQGPYFTFDELESLLKKFTSERSVQAQDVNGSNWNEDGIVSFRNKVSPSLNQGIAKLFESVPAETPIVEIGSGSTYQFPTENVIRLQPEHTVFRKIEKLRGAFQVSAQEFLDALPADSGKHIPYYFALNVFDVMPVQERVATIKSIAKTQSPDDVLLIVSDTNPFINTMLNELSDEYPDSVIYPYFPLPNENEGMFYSVSAVIIPKALAFSSGLPLLTMDSNSFGDLMTSEAIIRSQYHAISELFAVIGALKNKNKLQVVALESYYAKKLKTILEPYYDVKVSYHTSFVKVDAELFPTLVQPIIYKPVSDCGGTIRQWSWAADRLVNRLKGKGLALPQDCSSEILSQSNQKLIGSEMLVIKGTRKKLVSETEEPDSKQ